MMNVSMDTNLNTDVFGLGQAPFDTEAHPSREYSRQLWLMLTPPIWELGCEASPA